MFSSDKVKVYLKRRGWKQYWGSNENKWVHSLMLQVHPSSYLWYQYTWREAFLLDRGKERKKRARKRRKPVTTGR